MLRQATPPPRILLASTLDGMVVLRRALAPLEARTTCAYSHDEALQQVDRGIDVVVCSLRFDESRMLDFVAEMGRAHPGLPFVCCSVLESDLPAQSLRAAFTAAGHLGAVAVLDLPDLVRREGAELAERSLREAVLASVHGVGHASMS